MFPGSQWRSIYIEVTARGKRSKDSPASDRVGVCAGGTVSISDYSDLLTVGLL